MIETIENALQLLILLVCTGVSLAWVIRERGGTTLLLFFFYASFALADLYWLLYLVFYNHTPVIFYVSDLSWYASYLFLDMLVLQRADPQEQKFRHAALWAIPAFCTVMCLFYMQWGDYLSNVICAVLMSLLLYHSIRGMIYMRSHPKAAANRPLYIAVLVFCILEYGVWTTSCFWVGDTWKNPYFLFDCLMTVYMLFLLLSYRKAVTE